MADGSNQSNSNDSFRIPSPFIHKRQRTKSASEVAAQSPRLDGVIKEFCRERGHGFVTPVEGGSDLFVHVSDIDGEFVPLAGDEVTFQKCLAPPKNERYQAVHVKITHLKEGVTHHRWDGSQV
ncbi:calcium-regulated heat-stable protein 1-like [Watersipora subatra]|uniref:calcium-regulated heat-stable protein 1-like n=1 Tax=Watersipora subatra TaxID=2589382 RepID=UPI00355BD3A8